MSITSRRRKGVPTQRNYTPNLKNPTELEKQIIINHILNLDTRGFQLTYNLLQEMADKLLTDRGARRVSINWPLCFVNRKNELKLRVNQKYNYQRALNKDLKVVKG